MVEYGNFCMQFFQTYRRFGYETKLYAKSMWYEVIARHFQNIFLTKNNIKYN